MTYLGISVFILKVFSTAHRVRVNGTACGSGAAAEKRESAQLSPVKTIGACRSLQKKDWIFGKSRGGALLNGDIIADPVAVVTRNSSSFG